MSKPKMKTWEKILLAIFVLLFVTALVLAGLTLFYPIKPLQESYTYELGTPVDEEPTLYLDCFALSEYFCELNFTEVDQAKPGTYTAYIEHPVQTVPFLVVIEDTIAPELTLTDERVVLEVSKGYEVDRFLIEATDISGEVDIAMFTSGQQAEADSMEYALSNQKITDAVSFDSMGEYYVYVSATDPSGNVTTKSVLILADTAPTITPYREFYLAMGSDVDYAINVTAYDDVDGDVTGVVEVDASQIVLDSAGTYEVVYRATDSNGLTGSCSVPVNVYEPLDLQELINTRQINRFDQTIAGAYNLYDGGYFEEQDIKAILDYYTPAIVHIERASNQGSGFIVAITDTEVIICTNYHVLKNEDPHTITFFNRVAVNGTRIGTVTGKDIAFSKVSIEELKAKDEDILDELMTVHIDQEYLKNIENTSDLSVGHRTMFLLGGGKKDRTGKLQAIETPIVESMKGSYSKYYKNVETVCAYSASNYGGCSGSAVFDGYGHLIGMASFHMTKKDELGHQHYGMTVHDILAVYEELTGEKLNYK